MKKILVFILFLTGFTSLISAQDIKAEFPGGEKALSEYITQSIQYPAAAKENGIEGVVTVMFLVKADGSIQNIKIRRMIDPDLEAEAVRIVRKMPDWKPATTNGEAVDSEVEVSIPFEL